MYYKAIISIQVLCALSLSGAEAVHQKSGRSSYYSPAYQKRVNSGKLDSFVKKSLTMATKQLPEIEDFIKITAAAKYKYYDCLAKRLMLTKRLIAYIRREAARKVQPEGLLYARRGSRELLQFLEYFNEEKKRYDASQKALSPLIISVRDLGAKGDGITDDSDAFRQAMVKAAQADGKPCVIKVPDGTYLIGKLFPAGLPVGNVFNYKESSYNNKTFRPCHLLLANLKNVTLEGDENTKLLFGNTGYIDGIAIWGCENVTIKKLKLDFAQLPFTQGTIESVDPASSSLIVNVEKNYPLLEEPYFKKLKGKTFTLHDKNGNFLWDAGNKQPQKIESLGNRRYRFKLKDYINSNLMKGIEPGNRFVMCARYNGHSNAVYICRSKFTTLDNIHAYSSPCGGFCSMVNYGVYFFDCKIIPEPGTTRIISSNADGFPYIHGVIGPYINNCEFDGLKDDAIIVTTRTARIENVSEDGRTIKYKSRELLYPGAELAVLDSVTGQIKAEAVCKEVNKNTAVLESPLPPDVRSQSNLYQDTKTYSGSIMYYSRFPPRPRINDFIVCLSSSNIGAVITSSRFRRHRGNAIDIESPDAIAENNVISDSGCFGIAVMMRNLHAEALCPHNVVVRHNRIDGTLISLHSRYELLPGLPSFSPIRDILFEGNTAANARQKLLDLHNSADVLVKDNIFISSNGKFSPVLSHDENIVFENNQQKGNFGK